MRRTIPILAVLLGAQLLLALGLSFNSSRLTAAPADTPLLALEAEIDRLTLADGDGEQVVLARSADGWQLPDADEFPADQTKIDTLLSKLRSLKVGMPVATSEAARKRFKVAEDSFERRIELAAAGKPVATLYLGTAPTMRQIHVRRGGDDAVYAVQMAAYEVPVGVDDWQDKNLLQFPREEIEAIRIGELTLKRAEGEDGKSWTVETGDEADRTPDVDQSAADKLAQRLADLRFTGVLGREAKPEYGLEQPRLTLAVDRRGGESLEYALGKIEGDQGFALKVSSRPEYFRISSYNAENLIDAAQPEALTPVIEHEEADAAAEDRSEPASDGEAGSADETGSTGETAKKAQAADTPAG